MGNCLKKSFRNCCKDETKPKNDINQEPLLPPKPISNNKQITSVSGNNQTPGVSNSKKSNNLNNNEIQKEIRENLKDPEDQNFNRDSHNKTEMKKNPVGNNAVVEEPIENVAKSDEEKNEFDNNFSLSLKNQDILEGNDKENRNITTEIKNKIDIYDDLVCNDEEEGIKISSTFPEPDDHLDNNLDKQNQNLNEAVPEPNLSSDDNLSEKNRNLVSELVFNVGDVKNDNHVPAEKFKLDNSVEKEIEGLGHDLVRNDDEEEGVRKPNTFVEEN